MKIRQERFRLFSADKQFLQMYVESISTLHSIDNNSARTLKENPFDRQKDFYSNFFTMHKVYTRTHRRISNGVDGEK